MEKHVNVVLVTGASSGLGLAVSRHLFERGYIVYAGARSFNASSEGEKKEGCQGVLHKMFLDVTNQDSVDAMIKHIIKQEGRLDILVNCAAFLVLGSVEDTHMNEYNGVIETNFLGTVRMCKSAIPVMRKQKSGLIINFSSINGVLGIPFQSAYVSSKFAIEGFTECLSLELKDFGIKAVLVEPGDHRSGSRNYRPYAKNANLANSPYYEKFLKTTAIIDYDETNGSHPMKLAEIIYKLTLKTRPRLRYTIGKFDQRLSVILKRVIPGRLFEKIINAYYNKGQ